MKEMRENFAKRSGLQFTLREMLRFFAAWRTYGVLAIVIVVIAWSGPFETAQDFAFPGRFMFWASIIMSTYIAARFSAVWVGWYLRARGVNVVTRLIVVALITGFAASIAVLPVTVSVSGWRALEPDALMSTLSRSLLIAAAVIGLMELLSGDRDLSTSAEVEPDPELKEPRLLSRLPVEKRGQLVSLSVTDHYVEIVTRRGRSMILMRLKDAIGETEPEPGIQIHRSHWVALSAVEKVEREDGKLIVVTSQGARLSVSRSFFAAVRSAGLLPS